MAFTAFTAALAPAAVLTAILAVTVLAATIAPAAAVLAFTALTAFTAALAPAAVLTTILAVAVLAATVAPATAVLTFAAFTATATTVFATMVLVKGLCLRCKRKGRAKGKRQQDCTFHDVSYGSTPKISGSEAAIDRANIVTNRFGLSDVGPVSGKHSQNRNKFLSFVIFREY
ncbi:hypothetical protein AA0521_3085 [Komagataeibacter intermedius NRIC 0521]|uniref:Uncharacterized protein n=1 Tax=Komagataeibacter intermedius NRIC 0521 TaxID=1307934 RepID=A0ABQ0PQ52_9PROT|nr:hypothetical protein AA0521_3085 [Komagataeibacter intermedius NRIC 0521]